MVENERIAKLETSVDAIKEAVGRLERKFDEMFARFEERYLQRNEYVVDKESIEKRLKDQESEISVLRKEVAEKTGKVPAWAASIITLLFSSLVTIVSFMLTGR